MKSKILMDKPLDRGADTVKEAIKKAEKDKDVLLLDLDDEILQNLKEQFDQDGKPGETLLDYIKRAPVEDL